MRPYVIKELSSRSVNQENEEKIQSVLLSIQEQNLPICVCATITFPSW